MAPRLPHPASEAGSPELLWTHETARGYCIELRAPEPEFPGPELLRLVSPAGLLCATIYLDPEGPRIEVHGASLHATISERMRLEAERVEIHARTALELSSGGSIRQSAATLIESEAFEHHFESTHGELRLIANDDVAIDGERIRLNSPLPPGARSASSDGAHRDHEAGE